MFFFDPLNVRDSPLYLEWAPDDILSPNATLGMDEEKNTVGEKETKTVLLDQTVDEVSEVYLDPDRVEVRYFFFPFSLWLVNITV